MLTACSPWETATECVTRARQPQLRCQPSDHRLEIQMAVGDVERNHPVGCDRPQVGLQRFKGQQMGRDGIGAERIDDQQAKRSVWLLQGQAAVPYNVHDRAFGIGRESEQGTILGKADHHRVDLVEGEGLARVEICGEGAGAETDHANLIRR